MFSVLILAFISICMSLYAKDSEKEINQHSRSTRHGIVGILLVILVICQMAWAIIIRRYVNDSDSGLTRHQWLIGHRIFGTLIVIILLYNGYLGYQIYKDRFQKV